MRLVVSSFSLSPISTNLTVNFRFSTLPLVDIVRVYSLCGQPARKPVDTVSSRTIARWRFFIVFSRCFEVTNLGRILSFFAERKAHVKCVKIPSRWERYKTRFKEDTKMSTQEFSISTSSHDAMLDITSQVTAAVGKSGITEGLVTVFCPHTTG